MFPSLPARRLVAGLLLVLGICAGDATGAAGTAPGAEPPTPRRWDRMVHLLEKTFLKIDVATAVVSVDAAAAARLAALGAGHERLDGDLEQAMAETVLATVVDADCEIRFLVDVDRQRFLASRRQGIEQARQQGLVSEEAERDLAAALAADYAWMGDEGLREGDRIVHTLRGDSLTTRYVAADGALRHETRGVGRDRRALLLAGLFGRKSEFRQGLLGSFFADSD